MEAARDSITALHDAGLFDSAQSLGCFLVSSCGVSNEGSLSMKAESLVLRGDALGEGISKGTGYGNMQCM